MAYVLPGFIGLVGLVPLVPGLATWLYPASQGFSLGPPVYVLLAAAGLGMVLACFRWITLEQLHASEDAGWTEIAIAGPPGGCLCDDADRLNDAGLVSNFECSGVELRHLHERTYLFTFALLQGATC